VPQDLKIPIKAVGLEDVINPAAEVPKKAAGCNRAKILCYVKQALGSVMHEVETL
jgi:hypothetical protein